MIARKSFLVFLNMVAGSILGYVALFFILRYMTTEEFGIVGFGLGFVGLFAFVSDLGFNAAHVKRISEGRDLETCIGTFLMIKLVLVGIMSGGVIVSILVWKVLLGRGFETPEHEPVIYLFLLYYIILGLSSVPLATFSARRETARQQLPGLLEPITRSPLSILVALGGMGAVALAGSYVVGVVALLISAVLLFRGYSWGKFDRVVFRDYLKFAIPLAVSSGIILISLNADKVMIQLFWGATAVGYYFGVQRITMFIVNMSVAVTILLYPTLSQHHGKEEYEEVRKLTTSAERYISLIVMPCAALLIVLGSPILALFSPELAENAVTILQIMTIYSVITCLYWIFFNQLIAINKPRLTAKIAIFMHTLNIVFNLILIPKDIKSLGITLMGMGPEGAALATAISATCGLILYKHYARKLTGTKWNPKILLHVGAATIMAGIIYYMSYGFSIWTMFEPYGAGILELLQYIGLLGLMGALGIGIYVGILVLFKEFTKKDLKMFMDILNPMGMGRYVSSELRNKYNND